ncbi:MAG: response regulator transcription factor [Oculatellaceae cyanobacterium bins.114]|nr:response regulator transcription factor [Oculatellaceae cyanobacterium bins.114]
MISNARVLVAANSAIARVGLETLLAQNSALTVVGSVTHRDLGEQLDTLQPDVVLMELELQEDNPLSALPVLDREMDLPAIVVLVDNVQSSWVSDLLQSGIQGILPAEATADEIMTTIEAVATGLIVLHPEFLGSLPMAPTSSRSLPPVTNQTLTPREVEVLSMLAEGLGNKAIARRLTISEHTVKFHISSILSKMNASSRTEAVTLGARQGLILL